VFSGDVLGGKKQVQQSEKALLVLSVKHLWLQQLIQLRIKVGIVEIVLLHQQEETVQRQQTDDAT
jgi:hypothetical protein